MVLWKDEHVAAFDGAAQGRGVEVVAAERGDEQGARVPSVNETARVEVVSAVKGVGGGDMCYVELTEFTATTWK